MNNLTAQRHTCTLARRLFAFSSTGLKPGRWIGILTFFLVLLGNSWQLKGQKWMQMIQDSGANYFEIVDSAYVWFDADPSRYGTHDHTLFKRFQNFWDTRLSNSPWHIGDMGYAINALINGNYQPVCSSSNGSFGVFSDWKSMGPNGNPLQYRGGTLQPTHSLGRVNAIWVNPKNSKHVLVGGQSGGIFRTNDFSKATPDWENVTENTNLPALNITWIASDTSVQTLYATTDLDMLNGSDYGLGVIKSTDGGENWQLAGLQADYINRYRLRKIIVEPDNGNHAFAITYDRVFETTTAELHGSPPFFRIP